MNNKTSSHTGKTLETLATKMSDVDEGSFVESDEAGPQWEDGGDPYVVSFDEDDQHETSSDGSSSDCGDVLLPFESEHPNKYVPWAMKQYPPDVIEAWTRVHNCTLSGNHQLASEFLEKLSKEGTYKFLQFTHRLLWCNNVLKAISYHLSS